MVSFVSPTGADGLQDHETFKVGALLNSCQLSQAPRPGGEDGAQHFRDYKRQEKEVLGNGGFSHVSQPSPSHIVCWIMYMKDKHSSLPTELRPSYRFFTI